MQICIKMLPSIEDIKKLRKKLGISQSELAKKAGVSQSLIARIESGKVDPSYSKIRKVFNALELVKKEISKNIRAEDLMTTEVISISPDDSIENAAKLMMELKISQLPVIDKGKVLGSISEKTISALIQKFETTEQILEKRIKDVMEEPFPIVPRSCSISVISMLLEDNQAVIVSDKWGKITGIITKADLLKVLQRR